MALTVPSYLRVPGIQDPRIRYQWDDWNVEAVDMPLEPQLQASLERLSQRAIVAFTIATAEWIFYRFESLSDDLVPQQIAEAAWAQLADFRYSVHQDINRAAWRGPVRGPLGMAVRRVKFAIQQADTCGEPAWRAGRASLLAQHVLPDRTPYLIWRERIIERLLTFYPLDPQERLGEAIPREVFDPDAPVNLEETERLINEFLGSLDRRANPFLSSPEQMRAQGFTGIPYVFDVNDDRRTRFQW